jgi:glutathione synthase/RimK-type ligase-like ATP-grasp enzyme
MSQSPVYSLPDARAAALSGGPSPQQDALSWSQRGDQLQRAGDFVGAIAAYDNGLTCLPTDFTCLCHKGLALEAMGLKNEALLLAQSAMRVEPDNREALMLCAKLELQLGNPVAANACFRMVADMGVVRNYPAAQRPARFRLLLLFAPEAGNTPYESLIKDGGFDTEVLLTLRGYRNDPNDRSPRVDVVLNLLSDVDFGLDVMASAIDLADSLERPVINHPRLMLATDRASISQRLAFIPGAVMPRTIRVEAKDLSRRMRDGEMMTFPVIVRHAGMHGGEMMEMVDSRGALQGFAEQAGHASLYVTDFVDYRSTDGLYRKYRFIFVGDEIFPYHLAINDGWKVHHASTRMGEIEWMRLEEEMFLLDPAKVFGLKGVAALELIRRQVGLDYFGIDCALDADGNVVVFEVNASMLIHVDNPGFEYKVPYVQSIKTAFEQLLERRAMEYRATAK